ncbi:M23 family metallopeptidase [Bacteroides sp. 224]|uniref:M23 family metallopeptidase n=1 Tax=Bacteroides sp. 224 TaxID=2302936 RepID=UPI0013D8B694|nr:M23 family metallopeptidase [Bacteroides sp. 224]NDV66621.1 M23 family peptidase [Bacteroides sp. 224]
MKQYILACFLLITMQVKAQDEQNATFSPPFDFSLTLSGNFGELRANHFHGGLDFKTQGVSGKKVRALSDGYISRIRVTHGSGYVLDVVYDNGYSTINRHLSGFMPPIAQRVEDLQYETESWEVEIIPEVNEYRVSAGQQIAWSGNTGYSFGPHLHLDMLETATGDYIDPLPFFKTKIKDTRAPVAQGFMLFPQPGKGVINKMADPYSFQHTDSRVIEAWGEIGSAIKAYDYMDIVSNRYGVHTVILSVDGKDVFRSTVDRFSSYENRMINSWAENNYMKSFIEPGNTLRMLEAFNDNRGIITIDMEQDYLFQYTLKDVYGNTSRYRFVVRGKKQQIPPVTQREKYCFTWNKVNYLQEPGLDLLIPQGLLYNDVALNYSVHKADSAAISYTYQLHDKKVPLHSYCDLQIGLLYMPVADSTKYYIARINEKGKLISVGGEYEGGFVKARVRELGTYTAAVDTIAPEIIPVNPQNWHRNGKIVYKIKEEETGIKSYRGTIDGAYALFGLNIMNDQLVYEIDTSRVGQGISHDIEIEVTDNCGNKTILKDTFK